MRDFMLISRALADETRVRILMALRHQELCACQITELFSLAPSTMSKHLSILQVSGLVTSRKNGRWIYYALPQDDASPLLRAALAWIKEALADNTRVADDSRQIQSILKKNPSDLCRQQCKK